MAHCSLNITSIFMIKTTFSKRRQFVSNSNPEGWWHSWLPIPIITTTMFFTTNQIVTIAVESSSLNCKLCVISDSSVNPPAALSTPWLKTSASEVWTTVPTVQYMFTLFAHLNAPSVRGNIKDNCRHRFSSLKNPVEEFWPILHSIATSISVVSKRVKAVPRLCAANLSVQMFHPIHRGSFLCPV